MLSGWQMYQNRFTQKTCERIISLAKLLPESEAKIGGGVENDGIVFPKVRSSTLRWLNGAMKDFDDLFLDIKDMFLQVNCSFGLDINYLPALQFTEYHSSVAGKYDWHTDTMFESPSMSQRKISMVIQLSNPDDYEGGDLELQPLLYEPPDPIELRQQGSVIFFPSITNHRVTPITKGTRYSLVAWMEGPRWR